MILIECDPDEILVKTLISNITKKGYSHARNKTEVIKKLIRNKVGNRYIGIVDKDPGSKPPGYFNQFRLKERLESIDIEIFESQNQAKLVVLYPDLEGWIITAAHFVHVNLKDFSLPDSADDLHKIITEKPNLRKFIELVKYLESRSNHLKKLKTILTEYRE
ncbi:MAG: hypothetical protein ACTSQE_11005 [Candidatus Heimdallarchaeaceae archaeon]